MKYVVFFLFSLFIISSCVPAIPIPQAEVISVYATSAAQPWLSELYDCANKSAIVLKVNADDPDIYLRIGEPDALLSHVYQIDEEEILIVTHRESSIQNLTFADAQNLFAHGSESAQVWIYDSDADVQMAFDQLVMKERVGSSLSRIAVSPQNMSDILNSESNAVGILPRHWNPSTSSGQGAGSVREVYSAGTVPVLAITKQEPQGVVNDLIACLQSN